MSQFFDKWPEPKQHKNAWPAIGLLACVVFLLGCIAFLCIDWPFAN